MREEICLTGSSLCHPDKMGAAVLLERSVRTIKIPSRNPVTGEYEPQVSGFGVPMAWATEQATASDAVLLGLDGLPLLTVEGDFIYVL